MFAFGYIGWLGFVCEMYRIAGFFLTLFAVTSLNVTKSGTVTYCKVLRNAGFKYLVCCSSPMVKLNVSNFHTFYTNSLHSKASTVQVASS